MYNAVCSALYPLVRNCLRGGGTMWGSAPRPGRGLPQPQSSSRALPCPPVAQSRLLRYRLQPRFRCPAPGRFAASRQQATGLTLPSALVSVDSYGSLCASRKCPQGTRSPPSPCTPFLGLRPKGDRVWWVILALALRTHLGLRPKPRASRLGCPWKRTRDGILVYGLWP